MNEYYKGEDLETRVQQLEEAIAALKGDSRLADLPFGTLKQAASMLALRSVGGTLGGAFPAGVLNMDITPGAANLTANRIYAVPFYLPVPATVVKIGICCTTLYAGSGFRLGIYADKGEAMLYPHKLLLDAGAVSTAATGVKSIVVKHGLPRGLVWVVALGSHVNPLINYLAQGSEMWTPLGWAEDPTARYIGYYVSQAYGALPDPCPTGGTEIAYAPYIFLKFG